MSADPSVTAVGGTQFKPNYDENSNDVGFTAESVWDESNLGATGGGVSEIFSKPTYQNGSTPADGKRDVPDVAMIASPDAPGAIVVLDFDGQAQIGCCIGGTSLSAPVFAGVAKLLEQKLGAF